MTSAERIVRSVAIGVLLATVAAMAGATHGAVVTSEADTQVENLRAFARLYGYVRYFHPSDAAAAINWDSFAIYGAARVKDAKEPPDLQHVLRDLFAPIAPTVAVYAVGDRPPDKAHVAPPVNIEGRTLVAWQHLGVGFGAANSVYKSVRINRPGVYTQMSQPATLIQSVDAAACRGREIKLTASVRTAGIASGGHAQLWLRVDRPNNQMGFFDNMSDRPISNPTWRDYEISGQVAADAVRIAFGAILFAGSLWLDDVRLSVRTESGTWEPVPVKNASFEEGAAGQSPQGWIAGSQECTYKTVSGDAPSGAASLLMESRTAATPGRLFDEAPRAGETIEKPLGRGLTCRVPLALSGDDQRAHEAGDEKARVALDKAMKAIADQLPTADREDVRLGDVVIAWNVFQHFYPYFDQVQVDWGQELTTGLTRALADRTERDFYVTLSRMVAALQDGHGGVIHAFLAAEAGPPFAVSWIENRVVIVHSNDPRFQRGDVILTMDGRPADEVVKEIWALISGSPQWKRHAFSRRFGFGPRGTTVRLRIERDGKPLDLEFLRSEAQPVMPPQRPAVETLAAGVWYINLSVASWDEISQRLGDLAAAKGVVFDLRGYPRGNHQVISHLLRGPDTSAAWMRIPKRIYPDQERLVGYQEVGWLLPALAPRLPGRIVFLTDGRAISYAESFLGFIEHYKLADIIGEATAGTNGNVNPLALPGGFRVTWTGMRVVKHDGTQHHGVGILPTIPMQPTIRGVREGRDELLEEALKVIG